VPLSKLVPPSAGLFDEMFSGMNVADMRPHYQDYRDWLRDMPSEMLESKRAEADLIFRRIGITFSVYGDEGGTERLIPSDVVPRIIAGHEWAFLEKGLYKE
jgi:uncharacterized circularly permuted ATP-grasp superfamily protein